MKNHLFTWYNQKTFFLKSPPFSKKDVFFVCWFCLVKDGFSDKTNFPLVRRWFWLGVLKENNLSAREKLDAKPSFDEVKPEIPSDLTSPPLSRKKLVFWVFWFCLRPLSGQNRSALHVAVQWTVFFRSRTCQHAWRLMLFRATCFKPCEAPFCCLMLRRQVTCVCGAQDPALL